ncbi:hypothetical protein BGL85_05915 [Helicobacter pylori]|nr:hypothetical protein BGL85_05915 [Helicobacter pylori]
MFYCFSPNFIVKTHFLKVLKVLFYFLKGIGVNFALDPQKKGSPLKREFKKRSLKTKGSKETP